ncbi:MAG: ATP-dependent sacrificial sulfur transferase LarE [Candidatus Omnitrophota bacterium]|jgi:uncharacterized protein
MPVQSKLLRLKRILSGYGSCLVAFSGGVDSSFLLKACSLVIPEEKLLAVTAVSATYPEGEIFKARDLAKKIGVRLEVIRTSELEIAGFAGNSAQRCYFCKKELFSRMLKTAKEKGLKFVLDAGNFSDKGDYRPGEKAKKELGIKSPLCDAGITKEEVRAFSKLLGLPNWDKPSSACLASRIAYGIKITPSVLKRVGRAESYLASLGLRQVRLRHHGSLCRIETDISGIPRLMRNRAKIVDKFKKLGYNYVTLDLEGYRTGSLNEVIK